MKFISQLKKYSKMILRTILNCAKALKIPAEVVFYSIPVVILIVLILIICAICAATGSEETAPGDLLNGGRFAYKGNTVYMVNPADSKIYKIKKDKVSAVSKIDYCKNLVIHKNYIYYIGGVECGEAGIYKTNLRSFETVRIYNGNTPMFDIYDSIIYFVSSPTDGNKLSAMRTDGSRRRELSKKDVTYLDVDGDKIYYTDSENHLYTNDLVGKNENLIKDVVTNRFFVHKNSIYYAGENALMKYNLKKSVGEKLVDGAVKSFNIYKGKVYYDNGNGIFLSASNNFYSGKSDGVYAYDGMLITFSESGAVKINMKNRKCENISFADIQ